MLIFLYGFTTEEKSFVFPPPSLTLHWWQVAFQDRPDIWRAMALSVETAIWATLIALVLGTLSAMAMARKQFFGRDILSIWLILPIALPGIVTGIALRSSFYALNLDFSLFTLILGHATFCIVVVHNNAIARLRRLSPNLMEASADCGANFWQSFYFVILPNIKGALLVGGLLAFALSFDEIIVTTFTAGQQTTLPIWMFNELIRPRQRPVTNVVAIIVILLTLLPIFIAYYYSKKDSEE